MARSSSLKNKILSILFRAARLKLAQPLTLFFFKHMNLFQYLDRLCENDSWTAFHHPQPEYPLHILILPKAGIKSMTKVQPEQAALFSELFLLENSLIGDFQLDDKGYRLITNGGPHQSVIRWHWHLISEIPAVSHD